MEDSKLVSVCIPVYNAANYLRDCVESVIAQSHPDIEIIIVDNGSTDGSLEIANSFNRQNIYVTQETGKGASKARNKALSQAKGKYIQFLDADDLLSKDKIELQVKALESEPGKVAVCSTVHFDDGKYPQNHEPSLYEDGFLYDTENTADFLINLWGGNDFKGSMIQPNAWLVPRNIIQETGNWNEELTLDDDGEFFCRVVLNSAGIIKTQGYNYYRKHHLSSTNLASSNHSAAAQSSVESVLLKKKYLFSFNNSESAKKAIYFQLKNLAIRYYLKHPEAYNRIVLELKEFDNYKFAPVLGGKIINFIAGNISWKLAKRLQALLST